MISAKELVKRSGFYFLFKIIIGRPLYRAFYRKIEEVDKHNIPRNKGVIVTANHQNALMDPMALATHLPGRNVFLTRADVFKNPIALKIFTTFKMLPIYRIRDGLDSVKKKNEEVFDTCVGVLQLNMKMAMFPEGNHGEKRMLRQLVKGVFRIAFKAQSKFGAEPAIKILPVGVDYNHFQKFRQTLLIIYGEPIEVSDYWKQFEENPVDATNALRARLSKEIKKLIIHIETDDYYDLYMGARTVFNKTYRKKLNIKGNSLYDKFKADKAMIQKLDETLKSSPEKIEELAKDYRNYAKLRDKLNLRDWVFSKKRYSVLVNVFNLILCGIVSPMFILGLFNNWPNFFIPPIFAKKVKDPQFVSTAKWGIGSILLIIYYLIIGALALVLIPVWWMKIIYLILMPLSGIFALVIRKIFIKSLARIRYSFNTNKGDYKIARESRNKIIEQLNKITD